jgi:L-malate glycosyltransferase
MRLCIICEANYIQRRKWIRFFVGRGHDVHVVSLSPPEIEGARFYRLTKGAAGKYMSYLDLIRQCRARVREIRPDIVTALFVTDYGLFGALSGVHPLAMVPFGSDIFRHPAQKAFWRCANGYALRRSDLVVCNSQPMHDVLQSKFHVAGAKIVSVIWDGVNCDLFRPADAAEAKRALGLDNKVVLFSIRNLSSIYNIDLACAMFALLKTRLPSCHLVIAGNGSLRVDLEQQCRRLGLDTTVTFTGTLPPVQMQQYLAASDLVLTVPQSDSCSASLLEAFACERTVVASDIAANRDWIRHGENGWLVDPADTAVFADVCAHALSAPIAPQALARNRTIVKEKAEYTHNMLTVEKAFECLVRKMGPAAGQ